LDKIRIDIPYPGASPSEIERLVIIPVEQELKALDGIDSMNSIAFSGSGIINLDIDPDSGNRDQIAGDVQMAVDQAVLPDDLPDNPHVLEIDGSVFPVVQVAVSAPVSELELKRLGDQIEDDLLAIKGIARVQVQGDRKAEIRITVDPEKLSLHRVSIGEISTLLKAWNVNSPGGQINTIVGQKMVRIVGQFQNVDDVAGLVIRSNDRGDHLKLADVATIEESLVIPTIYLDSGGDPALNMIILKKTDADIIDLVDKVKDYIKTIPELYGDDVHISTSQDFSRFARLRLGVLTNNGLVGLILVFISLILFLRFSVAMTTTWSLPIVFLTGLFFLHLSGITLNLVSMLGFIMVLGMLVDDAIIIGENIAYHMEQGDSSNDAAVKGAYELFGPVTTTILTTVAAFLPLMYMSGMIGKFIIAIPVVVISLLLFSWLEAFLILPSHVSHLTNSKVKTKEKQWLINFEHGYAKFLAWVLHHRWIVVFISVLVLVGSVVLAKQTMQFQLFPAVAIDQYLVRVTAKQGTSLNDLRIYLKKVDQEIRQHIKPEHLETTILSSGQPQRDAGDALTQRGSRFGQIRVLYLPAILRPEHDAVKDLRYFEKNLPEKHPDLEIAFELVKPGPPTGRALEVEISSKDGISNEKVAKNLILYLKNIKGVTTIESGLQPGDKEIHVVLDKSLATYAGVNLKTAASHIRASVDGLRVTTTRYGTEEVDVTIRYPDNIDDIKALQNLKLPNNRGGLIPLSSIAQFDEKTGFTTIRHKEGLRVIRVFANIDETQTSSIKLNKHVADNQDKWLAEFKNKVKIHFGGEAEKNKESFQDLGLSFVFALVAIFFLLAIQFNNLGYPLIVMLAIPFGIVGVILSFYVHDILWKPMPLSFFSSMGMVALTGVVVNSSMILLVFIQRAREQGMEAMEAILLAGRRRLRAVVLTAATTVVGLLPTAYGWGGTDPFVAPMALALSWGLAFATLITLIVIPAALAASIDTVEHFRKWYDDFKKIGKKT
ncbi:MAG: efflux RND transporter permease subunit, partial [Gammaproteobacteria bacterium]|nr:efflux RND transporter permease subunit [Gammaproteobacteria bacterium]